MCGTRNGWTAVVEGAQNVVDGVACAPSAVRVINASAAFFIGELLSSIRDGKTSPCASGSGRAWALRLRLATSGYDERLRRATTPSDYDERLDVEVEGELGRGRAQADRIQLALDLVLDPGIDHVLGEDVAFEEELAVALQFVERFLQRAGHLGHVLELFRSEPVDVLVEGLARIDALLDAVEAGHQHRRERQVRIA